MTKNRWFVIFIPANDRDGCDDSWFAWNPILPAKKRGAEMTQLALIPDLQKSARFSPCRRYRYTLTRSWADGPTLNALALNPSTADESSNDPTVTRLERRAAMLGFGTLVVTNIFAFRSTDPRGLRHVDEPVGPENDAVIVEEATGANMTLCCWGSHGRFRRRGEAVRAMLGRADVELWALQVLDDGEPQHPLYLPYHLKPKRYCWDGGRA